jgi:hypothetical protein
MDHARHHSKSLFSQYVQQEQKNGALAAAPHYPGEEKFAADLFIPWTESGCLIFIEFNWISNGNCEIQKAPSIEYDLHFALTEHFQR